VQAGSVAIVTGSAGLVGAEAVRQFARLGLDVVGIDNDQRRVFFGPQASTLDERMALQREVRGYRHYDMDIRDEAGLSAIFTKFGPEIAVVVHAAAQPSHDWAAHDPATDFAINASATVSLLERARAHCPGAPFIFMSTNKVYGDHPNRLPLVEEATRFEVAPDHPYRPEGIDEGMPIDHAAHSLFGVSKAAADLAVQEYGRRFGMLTACFRAGCITGPGHRGALLHGFLAFLCTTAATGKPYEVIGYKGKQVRDNLHSADLVAAFRRFFEAPRSAAVYNIGGGRGATCSVNEALATCEELLGRPVPATHKEQARYGDHVWWVTDNRRFQADHAGWAPTRSVRDIATELLDRAAAARRQEAAAPLLA
jgi:CDP-paratose 2-epimerase